jgi:hypothetical protein
MKMENQRAKMNHKNSRSENLIPETSEPEISAQETFKTEIPTTRWTIKTKNSGKTIFKTAKRLRDDLPEAESLEEIDFGDKNYVQTLDKLVVLGNYLKSSLQPMRKFALTHSTENHETGNPDILKPTNHSTAWFKPQVHLLGDSMLRDIVKHMDYNRKTFKYIPISELNKHHFPGMTTTKFRQTLESLEITEPQVEYLFLNIGTNTASIRDEHTPLYSTFSECQHIFTILLKIYPNVRKILVSDLLKRFDGDGEKRAVALNCYMRNLCHQMNRQFGRNVFEMGDFRSEIDFQEPDFVNFTKSHDHVHLSWEGKYKYGKKVAERLDSLIDVDKQLAELKYTDNATNHLLSEIGHCLMVTRVIFEWWISKREDLTKLSIDLQNHVQGNSKLAFFMQNLQNVSNQLNQIRNFKKLVKQIKKHNADKNLSNSLNTTVDKSMDTSYTSEASFLRNNKFDVLTQDSFDSLPISFGCKKNNKSKNGSKNSNPEEPLKNRRKSGENDSGIALSCDEISLEHVATHLPMKFFDSMATKRIRDDMPETRFFKKVVTKLLPHDCFFLKSEFNVFYEKTEGLRRSKRLKIEKDRYTEHNQYRLVAIAKVFEEVVKSPTWYHC